ncbi:MAG: DUF427 domain-containing protein [Anaerolineae bacterium]|nr:DUF427 domain-containing protein [Anaerolineae bacterium]
MPIKRIEPGPDQESVWDYPRPPRLEDCHKHIQVTLNGVTIADTRQARRVLETSHPPVYYLPPEDVQVEYLIPRFNRSFCEWKGEAHYYGVMVGDRVIDIAAWYYPTPTPAFAALRMYIAFYAQYMDFCTVDGEEVIPQPGGFYGGWITHDVVGPFKGDAGSELW